MVRTAAVVVCAADLLDDAMEWAAAGLVADSYWVDADAASRIDPDSPNDLKVRLLRPRNVGEPAPLALTLSDRLSLDEIRVAWIRPPDAKINESLKALEQLLRELLPPDRMHWLDIVVPAARTDATVVPLPGQWVQLRILAEDRSAPDVTDAGWDLDLDVPLHAALVAIGILAGTQQRLPWGSRSAADRYEMRGFSRVVLGASDVHHLVDRFVGQTLPASSAGTVGLHPLRFLELKGAAADAFAEEAIAYVLDLESGTLSYRTPEPSQLQPPPAITTWRHVVNFLRFLGFGLLLLLGKRARPATAHSAFDFDDLGYNVNKPVPVIDWGVRIPDFDALDARAADEARRELGELNRELRRDPPRASPGIWQSLTKLATSINDGGPKPEGWEPALDHDRERVLAATAVQPTPSGPVESDVVELAEARSAVVAAAAVSSAAVPRGAALAPLRDATGVVATAQAMIGEGNARDADRLSGQLAAISAPTAPRARTLVDRLAGRVCGAALRARLDAERWSAFATEPSAVEPLDWTGATRMFRKRTAIGAAVCLVLAISWGVFAYLKRDSLPPWASVWLGVAVIGVLFLAFLLWSLYAFFQTYSAFLERGRRRLEIRRRWLERARVALSEHARLRGCAPAFWRWLDVLAALYPTEGATGGPPARTMPAAAPKGLGVALPVYTDREVTEWLRDEAAEVGWRYRALGQIMADALGLGPTATRVAEASRVVYEDDGLAGGLLYEVWEHRHDLWRAHIDALKGVVAGGVAERFLEREDRELKVLTPAVRGDSPVPFREFDCEPWPATNEDDDRWDDTLDFEIRDRLGAGRSDGVALSADVCALSVRVQLRRTDSDDDRGPDYGDDVDPDDY